MVFTEKYIRYLTQQHEYEDESKQLLCAFMLNKNVQINANDDIIFMVDLTIAL